MPVNANLISSLLKAVYTPQAKTITFQPGQMIFGKITKVFPNGIAALQIGAQKIVAQLEAPLEANTQYWFQVQPGDGKIRLKVMGNPTEKVRDAASFAELFKELSIPVKEKNTEIIRFFLKEQLPISKEIIQQTAGWLKDLNSFQTELEAVKQILIQQLPMTKMSFQAVLAVMNNESLTESVKTLNNLLKQQPLPESGSQLALFLQSLNDSKIDIDSMLTMQKDGLNDLSAPLTAANYSSDALVPFVDYLKGLTERMGFSYEHEVVQLLKQQEVMNKEVLKPLLIDFIKDNPSSEVKEAAEKILNKITGLQLLAQESGPIQQFVVQVPIPLISNQVDLTIQWSGRKLEGGKIDPDFCRVLFYLELQNLGETIVDMQVQNRIMKITVMNENENVKYLASPFIEQLKGNLQALHFTLSAVHFTHPTVELARQGKQEIPVYFGSSQYSGVDIRI